MSPLAQSLGLSTVSMLVAVVLGRTILPASFLHAEHRRGTVDGAPLSWQDRLRIIESPVTSGDGPRPNGVYQEYMNLNGASLEKHLGLEPSDIIEIPVLFFVLRYTDGRLRRTYAYFPDMVNHLVIGDVSIVPRPYGPKVAGECAFERAFRGLLPSRDVRFIDDWYSYHELAGEVHCGTNVRRAPPDNVRWWETLPDGGFDV